jgi:predicted RNase H-like HicB family nuclease
MTIHNQQPIYLCRQEDGTFLAASIDSPRFCVGSATEDEALEKAQRALDYYLGAKSAVRSIPAKETRVISPAFEERELVTA